MNEQTANEQTRSRIFGLDAGKEIMQQWVGPWADATATTIEQIHKLQRRMLDRTQEAVRETFDFVQEGVEQCAKITERSHQAIQEQLKRFGTAK